MIAASIVPVRFGSRTRVTLVEVRDGREARFVGSRLVDPRQAVETVLANGVETAAVILPLRRELAEVAYRGIGDLLGLAGVEVVLFEMLFGATSRADHALPGWRPGGPCLGVRAFGDGCRTIAAAHLEPALAAIGALHPKPSWEAVVERMNEFSAWAATQR